MNNRTLLVSLGAVFVMAGFVALSACSTSSSGSSSTPNSATVSDQVTVHVTAAEGGTVSDKSGAITLAIPAGALDKDTDITLAVSGPANGSAGNVYDFGPDGLKFSKAATLTIKADGVAVPAGKSVAVALLDGDKLTPLDGSNFSNGVATAPVMHFTKYTIVFIDGQAILQPPTSCAEFSSFTPCGGDVEGTWKWAEFCIDPKSIGTDPSNGQCKDYVISADFTSTRTVTFDATTVSAGAGVETSKLIGDFPVACFGKASCDLYSDPNKNSVCTDKGGGQCHCEQTETKDKPADTTPSAYTTSNNVLTVTSSNGKVETWEYCVKSNLLYARQTNTDAGTPTTYVMEKQ